MAITDSHGLLLLFHSSISTCFGSLPESSPSFCCSCDDVAVQEESSMLDTTTICLSGTKARFYDSSAKLITDPKTGFPSTNASALGTVYIATVYRSHRLVSTAGGPTGADLHPRGIVQNTTRDHIRRS